MEKGRKLLIIQKKMNFSKFQELLRSTKDIVLWDKIHKRLFLMIIL